MQGDHTIVYNGLLASSVSTIMCYPIDTIKNKLQTAQLVTSKGLFKGLLPDLIGSVPSTIVFWGVYSEAKSRGLSVFESSVLSGMCSNLVDTPFDLRKKQRQLNSSTLILPKTMIKFGTVNMIYSMGYNSVYMPLLDYLVNKQGFNKTISIFTCCTVANTLMYPIDRLRTHLVSPTNTSFLKGLGTRLVYGNLYSGMYMHIFMYLQNNKL